MSTNNVKNLSVPELTCYQVGHLEFPLVPAPVTREWMDNFPNKHPYRCLPLAIANAHGWQILSPIDVSFTWNGGPAMTDIAVATTHVDKDDLHHVAQSHFTCGIFTFHTGYIFRTNPGWGLMVTGPFNQPRANCYPLTGVVETYWSPYPFTMNYQFERPGTVYFAKGDPICQIMPIPMNYLGETEPVIMPLEANPKIYQEFEEWRERRSSFLTDLSQGDPDAIKQGWQKNYFRGETPSGEVESDHISKIRVQMPKQQS